MIFSSDVTEKIADWCQQQKLDPQTLSAFEKRNPAPMHKPGFTYKPIQIEGLDLGEMQLYQKIAIAPPPPPDPKPLPEPLAPKPRERPKPKTPISVKPKISTEKPVPKPKSKSWRKP